MTTPYPEDIERMFIDDYYFDHDKKYKREKLCNLRTNLAEGKCPAKETTIRAYCMWLEPRRNDSFDDTIETYSHKFYGKTIPKCKKQIDRKQYKKKVDDFILIEEEKREEIKVPEKKLSPEKPVKKIKPKKKLSPEKPPVQEIVKEIVKEEVKEEEEDFHFQEDIVKTNDDWDPLKGQDYIDFYKAKDKLESWIADNQEWRIKTCAWPQMFKNPTLFSKNCIKGYVRCILKQI